MNCPQCGAENNSLVINSRPHPLFVKRRRECLTCGYRFTTYEVIEKQTNVLMKLLHKGK